VSSYEIDESRSKNEGHERPKSWMKMKKGKIKTTRKLKEEDGYDIIWQFHTHPSGDTELHEIDLKILNYLSMGVMVLITDKEILGWFYDKRSTKKPIIEKMIFEVIDDL
jgi:proteasome lid subunit RPN8/RPN11